MNIITNIISVLTFTLILIPGAYLAWLVGSLIGPGDGVVIIPYPSSHIAIHHHPYYAYNILVDCFYIRKG